MKQPLPSTIAFWTHLVSTGMDILAAIEDALKAKGLPPLAWYDALLEIENAGADGVRPFALQERLLLPQSGMSRLLQRLEKADYIKRLDCEADGRGFVVVITSQGKAIRRRMWPVYAETLINRIEVRLSPKQAQEIADALLNMREHKTD